MLKFNNLTLKEFDLMWDSINLDHIQRVKKTRCSLWQRCKGIFANAYKSARRLLGYYDLPENLNDLSLGALLQALSAQQPSEVLKIVLSDLGINVSKDSDAISWWVQINAMLQDCSKFLESTNPKLTTDGFQNQVWVQLCADNEVPPTVWIVDKVAARFGLTYSEAMQLSWLDCAMALRIDKINAEFGDKVQQHQLQQSKRR